MPAFDSELVSDPSIKCGVDWRPRRANDVGTVLALPIVGLMGIGGVFVRSLAR